MAQGGQGTPTGQESTGQGTPFTGQSPMGQQGSAPTGYNPYAGFGGGYGPTGSMSGPDLSNMANQYGRNPQNLAAQMQYQGISPFNMAQAGVIAPETYTQMYRPSNQVQQGLNKSQAYQPIYQQQFQNYGSPEYSAMANANGMGAYNMLSQANMGPATSLASQSTFDPYSGTFNTPYGQASGLGQLIGSAGTPYALAQQQAAMNPFANLNPAYAWQQQQGQGGQGGQGEQGGQQQEGQEFEPVTDMQGEKFDWEQAQKGTTPDTAAAEAYKYDTYANFKPEELAGFNRNQINNLYGNKIATTQKDIKQAQLEYKTALKSGDAAGLRKALDNLNAQSAELKALQTDRAGAFKGLTGKGGLYELAATREGRMDQTALTALDKAAGKYTAFTAPTLKPGANSKQINTAYKSVINRQQIEMNNAKKALNNATGPLAKAQAQKYYDAQKADYDQAVAARDAALGAGTAPMAKGGIATLMGR